MQRHAMWANSSMNFTRSTEVEKLCAYPFVKNSGIQPVKKKTIQLYLNKLRTSKQPSEFRLASDRGGVAHDSWINWHQQQSSRRPFSCTVSENPLLGGLTIDSVNEGDDMWLSKRSISIDRNSAAIVEALEPLIKLSKTFTIIDPYFQIAGINSFGNLLECCQCYGVQTIQVVTSIEMADPLRAYRDMYEHLNVNDIAIAWITAPERFFHDRYVITESGAIRSGQGFMPAVGRGIHADQANLNLISKDEAERTLASLKSIIESGHAVIKFSI